MIASPPSDLLQSPGLWRSEPPFQVARGHAADDFIGCNAFPHHGTRPNHRAGVDRDAGQESDAMPDPDVVAGGDPMG
ncbi:MAG: hypothetical protein ACK4MS_03565 [Paracoccaceae bacterium]